MSACQVCALLKKLIDSYELFRIMRWTKFNTGRPDLSEEDLKNLEMARAVFIYLNLVKHNQFFGFPQVITATFQVELVYTVCTMLQLCRCSCS